MNFRLLISSLLFLFFSNQIFGQADSLILNNNNVLVGEIKDMDRGVLTMETPYSDSDFKVEWNGVKEIYTVTSFLITLSDGSRYNGSLETVESGKIRINDERETIIISHNELVFLKSVDDGFWSQLYASVDFGYSITRANNLKQLSLRSNIGYLAERWSADMSVNSVNSTQDSVEAIRRQDGNFTYRQFLPKDWFLIGQLSFLSNTEQKLDLRTNGKLGIGKYVIHTNTTYWAFQGGASFNNENFSSEAADKQSLEGFFGTELNLYDVGDLSLLTKVIAYPGITEKGRWRADFVFDTKYDLPLDFYIKLGFTLNYDNQPVVGASATDYVFQTTFGWEL
ncbi:DUF481 domain-containing protein [Flexithrix dorotheae]|uniref:DUF481 domain-containing protein n=1 Tax=Flexithrix dorotheae TaxID=70993 RepID=UPI000371B765|nr:DUF481 domain-containing protein [Flexithrix dorotheae]